MKEIDPVEELHKIRKAICKEAGGTPAAYARYYLEMSKKRADANKSDPVQGKSQKSPTKPKVKAGARKTDKGRKTLAT